MTIIDSHFIIVVLAVSSIIFPSFYLFIRNLEYKPKYKINYFITSVISCVKYIYIFSYPFNPEPSVVLEFIIFNCIICIASSLAWLSCFKYLNFEIYKTNVVTKFVLIGLGLPFFEFITMLLVLGAAEEKTPKKGSNQEDVRTEN